MMRDGRIVQIGTAEQILNNPANDFVAQFVQDVDRTRVLTAGSVMTPPVALVGSEQGPRSVHRLMREHQTARLFVVDREQTLCGAVDEEAVVAAVSRGEETLDGILDDQVVSVSVHAHLSELLATECGQPQGACRRGRRRSRGRGARPGHAAPGPGSVRVIGPRERRPITCQPSPHRGPRRHGGVRIMSVFAMIEAPRIPVGEELERLLRLAHRQLGLASSTSSPMSSVSGRWPHHPAPGARPIGDWSSSSPCSGWAVRGWRFALVALLGLLLIISMEQWETAMETLALVVVATVVAVVIAIPLGMLAARSQHASAVLRPIMDLMQTMPALRVAGAGRHAVQHRRGPRRRRDDHLRPSARRPAHGAGHPQRGRRDRRGRPGVRRHPTTDPVRRATAAGDAHHHGRHQPGHHAGPLDGSDRGPGRRRRTRRPGDAGTSRPSTSVSASRRGCPWWSWPSTWIASPPPSGRAAAAAHSGCCVARARRSMSPSPTTCRTRKKKHRSTSTSKIGA